MPIRGIDVHWPRMVARGVKMPILRGERAFVAYHSNGVVTAVPPSHDWNRMPRQYTLLLSLSLLLAAHVSPARAEEPKKKRPNIVFLIADDLRWNVLGCTGDKLAKTPNLDKLAKRGVLFRNHFVTTSI